MKKSRKYIIVSVVILLLVVIEQIIKFLIVKNNPNNMRVLNHFMCLTYVKNTGGAWGIGAGNTVMFIVTNLIILGIIIKFIINQIEGADKRIIGSLTLVLAGGIGNFIDRVFRGFVVDYIDLNNVISFPVFNLADVYVVIGCICLILCIFIYWVKDVKENNRG